MFVLEKRHPIETDIIIDILKSERIPHRIKSIDKRVDFFNPPVIIGYNIEIYSDLEHFDYAKKLIEKRIDDINKLNAVFYKPKEDNTTLIINNHEVKSSHIGNLEVSEYKPKKSILKSIVEWIIMEFKCLSKKQ